MTNSRQRLPFIVNKKKAVNCRSFPPLDQSIYNGYREIKIKMNSHLQCPSRCCNGITIAISIVEQGVSITLPFSRVPGLTKNSAENQKNQGMQI
jgi:hypothetical protein